VLIENEFGQVAIDGGFLRDTGVEITEMNSGCICCSLVGDFGKALAKVIDDFHPDRILIEPSGVGKLSDVLAAVRKVTNDEVVLGNAITVVDGKKCAIYLKNFGEFYLNQIANAGVIIMSRVGDVTREKLQTAAACLRQQNPKATIITTPWDDITGGQILDAMEKKSGVLAELAAMERKIVGNTAHDVFSSWGAETVNTFTKTQLESICMALSDNKTYGTILRAKGYVAGKDGTWYQFDYVPGETEIREAGPNVTGQLCVIGSGLKKDAVAALMGV
ncbi:MAG: GTP-binding protein, partial [Eubacteriales bacterium]